MEKGGRIMQGTMTTEQNNYDDKAVNNRLIAAYQKAYDSYHAACDRYDKLVQAYTVLRRLKTDDESTVKGDDNDSLPYTEKIMRKMIEDADNEKSVIADHARECIKRLRSLKYEM
jgi:hypothetical protein